MNARNLYNGSTRKAAVGVPVLALSLLLSCSPAAIAGTPINHQITLPSGATWCNDTDINELLRQVNIFRASNGYSSLPTDPLGMKDAELRAVQFSQYMQQVPLPSPLNPHQGWDTTAAGIGYQVVQENLAYMASSPAFIVLAAWNDFLHIQAMLNNQANVAGVSCIVSQGIPYWSFDPGCTNAFCGQSMPQGPGVTITSPSDSASVSGQITLQGTTAGNGVTAVAVQVDGGPFAAAAGVAAWTYGLNSTALSNGSHTIGVRATDSSGRTTTTFLPLTVSNTASPPTGTPTLDSEEWAFLPLINNYRAQNGAGQLQVSVSLTNAAKWMSQDMAANNYLNHTDSTGRTTGARLADFGYGYTPWGEDLAGGYAAAQDVFTAWQTGCDPDASGTCTYAHRTMMLEPSLQVIGMARCYGPTSAYGWYWTADFGGVVDAVIAPPTGGGQPPTITITQPAGGATVSGTVSVQGTAGDAVGLSAVTVSLDGGAPAAATGLQNWSYALGTATLANGAHTITAKATNSAGLSTSASLAVTVSNTSSGAAPVISYFGAPEYTINLRDVTTLSWLGSGAATLSIDRGVGIVSGLSSKDVSPTDITPYVLTATNPAGTSTAMLTISTTRPCRMDLIQQNLALLAFPPDIACRTINEYFVGTISYRAPDGKSYKTTTSGTTTVACASNTPSLPNGQIPNMFDGQFDWQAAGAECWYTIGDVSPTGIPPYGVSSQKFCGFSSTVYVPINVITILTPVYPAGNGSSAPVIIQQPQSVTVASGQPAIFTISATGASTYQWQSQPAGGSGFSNISGGSSASYTTPSTSDTDNGKQFRCVVANSAGDR